MNRKVSVAPMMDCTDRHERYFLRLISKNVLLYTEMIVSEAISRGDKAKLLNFNINEKPLALQIGGSSPKLLGDASKDGENFGYDEINLNLGCPSRKVEKNKFGACLMKEPNLVADCLSKMQASCKLPITIKTRIGYDDVENYENFNNCRTSMSCHSIFEYIISPEDFSLQLQPLEELKVNSPQESLNMDLVGNLPYSQGTNDIWGYADGGNEYALVGTVTGFSVVDISNPSEPTELFFIDGSSSTWRDVKTWENKKLENRRSLKQHCHNKLFFLLNRV